MTGDHGNFLPALFWLQVVPKWPVAGWQTMSDDAFTSWHCCCFISGWEWSQIACILLSTRAVLVSQQLQHRVHRMFGHAVQKHTVVSCVWHRCDMSQLACVASSAVETLINSKFKISNRTHLLGLLTKLKARLSTGFLLRVNVKANQKRPVRVKTWKHVRCALRHVRCTLHCMQHLFCESHSWLPHLSV